MSFNDEILEELKSTESNCEYKNLKSSTDTTDYLNKKAIINTLNQAIKINDLLISLQDNQQDE